MSDVCQPRVLEEHCKKSFTCINRQTTNDASRRCNNLSTYDNSYRCTKMHESAIPLPIKNKVSSDRQSKKHSKSMNNANTDNRKMTRNVNIYICSENNQVSLIYNLLHHINIILNNNKNKICLDFYKIY